MGAVGIQDMDFVVYLAAVGDQFGAENVQLAWLVADTAATADDVPAAGIALGAIICPDDIGFLFFLIGLFNSGHLSFSFNGVSTFFNYQPRRHCTV